MRGSDEKPLLHICSEQYNLTRRVIAITDHSDARLVLAVPDGESQDTINNSLTFALLWLDRLRNGSQRGTVGGLRLIVPKECCSVVAHRFAALAHGLAIELYERDPARDSLERIDARRDGNLHTWLIPCRESEALLAQARAQIEPIWRPIRRPWPSILHHFAGGSFALSRAGVRALG